MYSRLAGHLFVVLVVLSLGPGPLQAQTGGWLVLVADPMDTDIQAFEGELVVPAPPTTYNDRMVVFLNLGLIGGDPQKGAYTLLQAVLQWGPNGKVGGQGWLLSCWSEERGAFVNIPPSLKVGNSVLVLSGETVQLSIRRDTAEVATEGGGKVKLVFWECEARSRAGAAVLTSVGEFDPLLSRAQIGLEAIGYDPTCANFPADGTAVFNDLRLVLASGSVTTPDWQEPIVKNEKPLDCGFGATPEGARVEVTYKATGR